MALIQSSPWQGRRLLPVLTYCVLFGRQTGDRGDQTVGILVAKPLCKFKDAKEQLRRHHLSSYHSSMAQGGGLLAQTGGALPVEDQVDSQRRLEAQRRQEEEQVYRTRLLPIAETVTLCGRQELVFRGHRDEGPLDLSEQQPAGDVKERGQVSGQVSAEYHSFYCSAIERLETRSFGRASRTRQKICS